MDGRATLDGRMASQVDAPTGPTACHVVHMELCYSILQCNNVSQCPNLIMYYEKDERVSVDGRRALRVNVAMSPAHP